jgi:hypothetical protein
MGTLVRVAPDTARERMGESQVLMIAREDFDYLPDLDRLIATAAVRLGKARIVDEDRQAGA